MCRWNMTHLYLMLKIVQAKQIGSLLYHAAADKGDLLQVIVAEDLFERIGGESAKLLMRATYKAARRWAGQDEVARARMMSFLHDACPSTRHFMQVCSGRLLLVPTFYCLRITLLSGNTL